MKKIYFLPLLIVLGLISSNLKAQSPQPADQIIALVNNHVILKSDIDADVANYIRQSQSYGQPVSFSTELWYQFLEASIENYILIEKARVDSIVVPEERITRQMDQRVSQLIQQAGSERALEQAFGKSIIQLKDEFRDDFREQMLTEMVRQNKFQTIKITRPEVREFFNSIPVDSLPTIPEQVALSQIVILPPAKEDARESARELAESLRDSALNHGKSIEELARRHSDGPSGPRGGLLPMMALGDLVSEYSAAASALQPGQISNVVETEFGFHVIQLIRRVGDQIETRHILISVDASELDDDFAIERLEGIKDSLESNPELSFSAFAQRVSEDPATKISGGKIQDPQTGERLIPLNRLDPALYRIVLVMDEVGAISDPRPFNPNNANAGKAFRIVRLDRQIPEHVANFDQDYERLKSIALQQKQFKVYSEWIEKLKDDFYIEYRIPVPNMEVN
ncbi:MAG: peptidylprolyl isomerase [Balneolaceae bacterium]|nr:peptidylprolyl isomerase [Balneolaceae bacterium]MBO6546193.1 peptidylprolyl isomerase [Balneolaceae bacterium]MBO6648552.1 peptidylprolyl isomerase [Balneolaceae bacterium]